MPLTINQTRDDLLSKLSLDYATAPAQAVQDVLVSINQAMQILQTAGEYYFTRVSLSLPFSAGTALVLMAGNIQTVIGPARWNNSIPLKALTGRGEYDQYDRIFGGLTTYGPGLGTPQAYFVENLRNGVAGDIVQTNIYLCPIPNIAGTLVIDVINDAPNYSTSDFSPGTAILPVAQAYIESVFLPIARMCTTRSAYFSRPDYIPQLQSDYDRAIQHLVAVGGFPDPYQVSPQRKIDE